MRSFPLLLVSLLFCNIIADPSCNQACASSLYGTTREKPSCDCCYENIDLESLTSRDWWLNTKAIDEERNAWFRKRLVNKPIVGEDTVVVGVLYTFSARTLKMTILFPPLYPTESRTATLVVTGQSSETATVTTCTINEHTWHCLARLDDLPHDEAYSFEVIYHPDNRSDGVFTYDGFVPIQVGYPRIAAMGCFGRDNTKDKSELVSAVGSESADILLLQGDQVYGSDNLGYGATELVYSIHELTRSMPTIVQLDDHDYGQGNIWGADNHGEMSGAGFTKPPCLVNALQDLSLGHLPDPVSKKTLLNGISIHYTNNRYGLVDFAILEARKFKNYKQGSSLLGQDQEQWLQEWCATNRNRLRIVLAQTPFASLATNATNYKAGITAVGAPIDTNAQPVAARQRFMEMMENCSPLILSGDQHLGTAVTYDDYKVSEFASPAVVNDIFWRLNFGTLGESYIDPFGNQFRLLGAWNVDESVWSRYSNPIKTRFASNAVKQKRADGFMMVDLDGQTATCEMHGYRNRHDVLWKAEVPCPSPRLNRRGHCFDACFAPSGRRFVCENSLACSACDSEQEICSSLCGGCPTSAPVFDNLDCVC